MRTKRNAAKVLFSPEKPKTSKISKRNVNKKQKKVAEEVDEAPTTATENGKTYTLLNNVPFQVRNSSAPLENQNSGRRVHDEYDGFESEENDSTDMTPLRELKPSRFDGPSSSTTREVTSDSSNEQYAPILVPSFMRRVAVTDNESENVIQNSSYTPTRRATVPAVSHSRTKLASINNKWLPISFSEENFYDSLNGVPLCQATIEENVKKLMKTDKIIDPSEFLELASEMHGTRPVIEKLVLGMVFMSNMLNKTLKRETHSTTGENTVMADSIVPGIGFNLIRAKENEQFVLTPSGRLFKMSDALNVLHASSWTSSKFRIHSKSILRKVFSEVAKYDPYFIACTPAQNSTKDYVPFSHDFFRNVSAFIIKGFGQSTDMDVETYTTRLVRDSLTNLLDRLRAQYTSKTDRKVEELACELKNALNAYGTPQRVEINFNAPSEFVIRSTT